MKKWIAIASLVVFTAGIGLTQASVPQDHTSVSESLASVSEDKKTVFNDKCPISGRAVNQAQTSDFKVEFCCKNCKGKFDKTPGKHLAKAADAKPGTCIFNGREAKTSSTVTVGFCCGGCKGKFDDEPRKFIAKVKPVEKEES